MTYWIRCRFQGIVLAVSAAVIIILLIEDVIRSFEL
jgi:hypothetical protein